MARSNAASSRASDGAPATTMQRRLRRRSEKTEQMGLRVSPEDMDRFYRLADLINLSRSGTFSRAIAALEREVGVVVPPAVATQRRPPVPVPPAVAAVPIAGGEVRIEAAGTPETVVAKVAAFSRVLTPARFEILALIASAADPVTTGELAERTQRNYATVLRDTHVLLDAGIVTRVKTPRRGLRLTWTGLVFTLDRASLAEVTDARTRLSELTGAPGAPRRC